jgi:uncharacterized membrane protein
MMNLNLWKLLIASVVLSWMGLAGNAAKGQEEPVDFKKQIEPLFVKYCLSCHGPEEEQVFRIDNREDSLYYVEAGNADESQLYEVLISEDPNELMPPPDEDNPMSKEEIELVKVWINQGAHWPESTEERQEIPAKDPVAEPARPEVTIPVVPDDGDAAGVREPDQDQVAPGKGPSPTEIPPARKTDPRIFRAIGSLHPALLHLPMGLLLGAGFFALLSLRGNFVMSDCAYYCLWIGMIGCILASVSGWYFSPMKRMGTVEAFADLWDTDQRVFWHRTGGLAVTFLALFLALYASSSRNKNPDNGAGWKLGVILLAVVIGWVGHEGGKLSYGKNHYKDLNELAGEWFPALFGPPAPAPPKANPPALETEAAPTVEETETGDFPRPLPILSDEETET